MTDKKFYNNQDSEKNTNKKSKLLSYPTAAFSYKGSNIAASKVMLNKETETKEVDTHQANIVETKIEENIAQAKLPLESQINLETAETEKQVVSSIAEPVSEPLFIQEQKNSETPIINTGDTERVIPESAKPSKNKTSFISLLKKYSRFLLVLLIILFLFFIFWLLKPQKPQMVESLEDKQVNELPLEFRPIDEEEAKKVEALRQQELEQKKLEAEKRQTVTDNKLNETKEQLENELVLATENEKNQKIESNEILVNDNKLQTTTIESLEKKSLEKKETVKPETIKQNMVKPSITTPVVKHETRTEHNKKEVHKAPVEVIKHQSMKNSDHLSNQTKSLVIKEGVSLMQLFRDNRLNLSDINRMTRAKGADRVFRHLSGGDRVMVYLNKQGRVVKMALKGHQFIRQSNGQYILK